MADLQKLKDFAEQNDFGLTRPLSHRQVERLAENWLPEMRFYEDERFHPISLDEMFSMVEDLFSQLSASDQAQLKVNLRIRSGTAATNRAFDPPVVYVPDGSVQVGQAFLPVVRALNEGTPARNALSRPEVDGNTAVSHGANFGRSSRFFGAEELLKSGEPAGAGNPFLPRAKTRGNSPRPRVTVMAALLNLFELFKYELAVSRDQSYPPDGLRRAFNVAGELLQPVFGQPPVLDPAVIASFFDDLIQAHEQGGALPDPPPGWRLNRVAWNALTRFAFLEYYFFYAYNDFERYQTALFDNEHEGDDEGCCLVFDRNVLNVAASSNDPQSLLRAVPHSIITSVHEEYQDADILQFIPTPLPSPDVPLARDVVPFTVYIAGGSHATYLTPGIHDLVDFGDTFGYVEEEAPILLVAFPVVLAIAIILAIIEHFVDTEDFTSDDGVRAGPDSVVGNHPAKVASRVIVLPMSANNHIYEGNDDLLLLRAYAGKWGGHDGIVDKSPPFTAKTGRYFRKLIDKL